MLSARAILLTIIYNDHEVNISVVACKNWLRFAK